MSRRATAEDSTGSPSAPAGRREASAPATEREGPSKSELKRRMHELQALGEDVAALPADRLAALQIEDRLRDAIVELGRTRSHEGRRRQMQYIGKLMKFEDAQSLREAVASWRLGGAHETLALHEAEAWRERLLAGDEAMHEWLQRFPDTDAQQLRSLVRAARRQSAETGMRQARPYRELFQALRAQLRQAAPGACDPADAA